MNLLGRERELDFVRDRLSSHRLVTVVGPGGIGKTSLAQAAVQDCAADFALGHKVVDLTRTSADADVGQALAGQLGFASFQELIESPIDHPVLLFIDNCEHVVDSAAESIWQLLESCEAPTILATSRSPLDLPGESLVLLGPLGEAASIELFTTRARDAGTEIGSDQVDLLAEMVRRLDGVPLAIDLAAARTRSLTVAEMLDRFDDHLALLSRPRFRGDPRHRSLRSTIEWSYELLPEDLQRFFDQLGVFAGPFTADIAHRVAGVPAAELHETQDGLDALIDASLLVAEAVDGATWYRLLVSLRALANERLEATGQLDATWERYVELVVAGAEHTAQVGRRLWDSDLLVDLLARYHELAAAARWCLDHDETGDRSFVLISLMRGVIHQAHAGEVEAIGSAALERWPDTRHELWAEAAGTVATARFILGRLDGAEALANRAAGGPEQSNLARVTLGRVQAEILVSKGESAKALDLFDQIASTARSDELVAFAMLSEVFAASIRADLGQVEEARMRLGQIRVEADRLNSNVSSMWARNADAYVQLRQDPVSAIAVIAECLDDSRAMGFPVGVTTNLRSLTLAHLLCNDVEAAIATTLELLDEASMGGGRNLERDAALHISAAVLAAAADMSEGPVAERLRITAGDVAASVRDRPPLSLLASPSNPLVPLPDLDGHALTIRAAVMRTRDALRSVSETSTGQPGDVQSIVEAAPAQPERDASEAAFIRRGDMWELTFSGRSALLHSTKGLEDVAELLGQPGREVHVLDLAGAGVTEASTGEVVDAAARQQYEERIRELQAELEEAEANNDTGRAEHASIELDELVEHLTSVMGLAGKTRLSTDSGERARAAVTQRIRAAIRKVDDALPALGRHLQASIHTGRYCSYQPEHHIDWHIERDA